MYRAVLSTSQALGAHLILREPLLQVGRLRLQQVKALDEPRSWDLNPTCDSETCKFNPFPVNCLLRRWRQPVMRSGSGLWAGEDWLPPLSLASSPRCSVGLRVPGVRCHHLPPTSTCPFGPLCPAGTVAPISCGLQMLPASTWVSSLHAGRSERLGTSCHGNTVWRGRGMQQGGLPPLGSSPHHGPAASASTTSCICPLPGWSGMGRHQLDLWLRRGAGPGEARASNPQPRAQTASSNPTEGREKGVLLCPGSTVLVQPRDRQINTPGHPRRCSWASFKSRLQNCVWSMLQLLLNQCSVGGEKVPGWWLPLGGRITGDLKFIFSPVL